jgi:hypothetical protein
MAPLVDKHRTKDKDMSKLIGLAIHIDGFPGVHPSSEGTHRMTASGSLYAGVRHLYCSGHKAMPIAPLRI